MVEHVNWVVHTSGVSALAFSCQCNPEPIWHCIGHVIGTAQPLEGCAMVVPWLCNVMGMYRTCVTHLLVLNYV